MPRQAKKQDSPTEESQDSPINGVLVRVVDGDEGQSLDVQTVGTIKVTEVPALLGLARKVAEGQLGL